MILVGLTGGIGSGKTTIAKLFLNLGIPVFFADEEAKWLMQNSLSLKAKIIETFGEMSYVNNNLNRAHLANIVFNDKIKLNELNQIVHPEVKAHFKTWLLKQKSDYIIYENAILFESDSASDFDLIICVIDKLESRIDRVVKRDHTTRQQVIKRIENQMDDIEKVKKSNFVIKNDSESNLKTEVLKIHNEILRHSYKVFLNKSS